LLDCNVPLITSVSILTFYLAGWFQKLLDRRWFFLLAHVLHIQTILETWILSNHLPTLFVYCCVFWSLRFSCYIATSVLQPICSSWPFTWQDNIAKVVKRTLYLLSAHVLHTQTILETWILSNHPPTLFLCILLSQFNVLNQLCCVTNTHMIVLGTSKVCSRASP